MFQPIVPVSGLAGWQFLQRTMDSQKEAFVQSAQVARTTEAFRARIGDVLTAEQLVNDRELLTVALGAYGLEDDLNNRAFILKVLEDGTIEDDALANRLSDRRYATFSEAMGFGNGLPQTVRAGFADDILARYETKAFEAAVGNADNNMRLALNLRTELADVVAAPTSGPVKWFAIMGSSPLRTVFEGALGFPSSFGSIDIDQQREQFQDRAQSVFGTDEVADFLTEENQEKLIRLFLIRQEAASFNASAASGSIALTLLQS